jgi:hypothetical protein
VAAAPRRSVSSSVRTAAHHVTAIHGVACSLHAGRRQVGRVVHTRVAVATVLVFLRVACTTARGRRHADELESPPFRRRRRFLLLLLPLMLPAALLVLVRVGVVHGNDLAGLVQLRWILAPRRRLRVSVTVALF